MSMNDDMNFGTRKENDTTVTVYDGNGGANQRGVQEYNENQNFDYNPHFDEPQQEEDLGFKPSDDDSGRKALVNKSRLMKVVAAALYLISVGVIFALTFNLAIMTYNLAPYYTFWPFLGVIFIGIIALAFLIITAVVTRKKSFRSIRYQGIAILVTFFCLTTGFGIILEVVFPDVLNMATQGTLHADDMYQRGEEQINTNVALNRQFIRYNIFNGNMQGDRTNPNNSYAYIDMSRRSEEGATTIYEDPIIEDSYNHYMKADYDDVGAVIANLSGSRKELYDFVYNNYVLLDLDYSFASGPEKIKQRRSFALAICDKTYNYYQTLCKEGFSNPRLEALRVRNFDSMDKDGYVTFDDPLLLYAQSSGRMTVPVVVRLILDETWMYSKPVYNSSKTKITGYDGPLFELYDPQYVNKYWDDAATDVNRDGTRTYTNIDSDEAGYIMHNNGMVERPIKWCVLDMDGNNMAVADNAELSGTLGDILKPILGSEELLGETLKQLLNYDIKEIIKTAANGAQLKLGLYLTDEGGITFSVVPSNVTYGVLGYMQMSWMNSNNLLVGVINLLSNRNNVYIFGGIGLLFVLAANFLREHSKKLAERVEEIDKKTGVDLSEKKSKRGRKKKNAPEEDSGGDTYQPIY